MLQLYIFYFLYFVLENKVNFTESTTVIYFNMSCVCGVELRCFGLFADVTLSVYPHWAS